MSGKRLDAYLRDNMFAPLGMNDTGFKITDSMRKRLVGMHARGAGRRAGADAVRARAGRRNSTWAAAASTARRRDYIKFTQMILNKGRGNGNQVLKPETVALMGQNHIGDLTMGKMTTAVPPYTNDVDLYPDIVKKWGLSFMINTAKTPEGRSAGSLAWAGLANTYFWIDPARNVAGVILMQLLPFADGKAWRRLRGLSAAFMPGSMPAAASARRKEPRGRRRVLTWRAGAPALVVLRECGGSSTPRPIGSMIAVSGILDRPPRGR